MKRLIVLAMIALALAPGTWLRTQDSGRLAPFALQAERLATDPWTAAPFTLKSVWQLDSPHPDFGGFSALAHLGNGQFMAGSDRGYLLRFAMTDDGPAAGQLERIGGKSARRKRDVDLEAMMVDDVAGQYWAAYERSNSIALYSADGRELQRIQPAAMRDWLNNSGPEAMAKLPDGRTLIIAERKQSPGGGHTALLLPPNLSAGHAEAASFSLGPTAGYSPTDIAIAPNGQALAVLRKFDPFFSRGFVAKIARLDSDEIQPNRQWKAEAVVSLGGGVPLDNYEGIAIVPNDSTDAGDCDVWLISDDNFSALQATYLVQLNWAGCGR